MRTSYIRVVNLKIACVLALSNPIFVIYIPIGKQSLHEIAIHVRLYCIKSVKEAGIIHTSLHTLLLLILNIEHGISESEIIDYNKGFFNLAKN